MSEKNFYDTPGYSSILVQYEGDIKKAVESIPDASVYILNNDYAILSIINTNYEGIIKDLENVVYIEVDGLYTLNDITPIDASNAPLIESNPYLNLNGTDVIVGIIDTGIDYLNPEFSKEDDSTRIIRLWDQSLPHVPSEKIVTGFEYTEKEINEAIKAYNSKSADPYSIVASKDTIGHGTKMAIIVGGRGKNPQYKGVANNCDFAIVKLQQSTPEFDIYYHALGDAPRFRGQDLILAINYLYNLARELSRPMVIYIPLGANIGAHDGTNVIERYIDEISQRRGLIVVTSTGNQGNSDVHTFGTINKVGDVSTIEIFTPPEQTGLFFEVYITKPDKVILSIVSPSGEVIQQISPKALTNPRLNRPIQVKFIYENTTMDIIYVAFDPATGDERLIIRASDLKTGIWQFKLTGSYIVSKTYNAWLLQKELLAPGTKFLNPTPQTTLTIPGTSEYIATTAFYNQNNNSIASESGRGFTRHDEIKPLIASGGINAPTLGPGNTPTTASGGSVASAVLSGCCAILLQWGIVQKNDPNMYALTIQTYLIRGAKKRPGDTYPNTEWGYGMLDLLGVFNSLREDTRSSPSTEYNVNNIFVRLPDTD